MTERQGYALAVPPPCEAGWTCDWPPTARPGVLIACDKEPGYYTHKGTPILFAGPGWEGFYPERHFAPLNGLLVYEMSFGSKPCFAVVRRV